MARQGFDVIVGHIGGADYAPHGAQAVWNLGDSPPHIPNLVASYYCNEDHFSYARNLARRNGLETSSWSDRLFEKSEQRERLDAWGASSTSWSLVNSAQDLKLVILKANQDLALKPNWGGGGSRGVLKVPSGCRGASLERIIKGIRADSYPVLVEGWIAGDLLCADGHVQDGNVTISGIGHCIKHPRNEVVISGIVYHAEWSKMDTQVSEFIRHTLQVLGISNGPFHIELIDERGKLYLVEAHGRFGGSIVPRALELHSGLNPFLIPINSLVVERRKLRTCAVEFVYPMPGVEIGRCERYWDGEFCEGVRVHGDELGKEPDDSSARVAFLVGCGADVSCMRRAFDHAHLGLGLDRIRDEDVRDHLWASVARLARM